ncbi:MAG: hypothetical protein R3D55_17150 [Chloroflexota bacterium]
MTRAGEAEWEQARKDWQKTAVAYQSTFHETADSLRQIVPLGWLQGYTNLRTMDSEGWAQGLGHRPDGSEGWGLKAWGTKNKWVPVAGPKGTSTFPKPEATTK